MDVELCGVGLRYRSYASETVVFDGLDLTICHGERVGILGDNGCGKSTLLGLIAGLHRADAGQILWEGVSTPPPVVGYCPQDYSASLLPWFRIDQNLRLPLRLLGRRRHEAAEIVRAASDRFKIFIEKQQGRPEELSGGYQQRVALARALSVGAPLVALDEPFASQDSSTAETLAIRISEGLVALDATGVAVLHDVNHALIFASRIIVLGGQPARIVLDRHLPPSDDPRDIFSAYCLQLKREIHAARAPKSDGRRTIALVSP